MIDAAGLGLVVVVVVVAAVPSRPSPTTRSHPRTPADPPSSCES